MAVSYDAAFAQFESKIEDAKREWCAGIMRAYPFKAELEEVAEALRKDLHASQVEVNSISSDDQTTVAKAPTDAEKVVPVRDSLCVLTVGAGEPGQVSDLQGDPFAADHAMTKLKIGSWASVPIRVAGVDAGAICAMDLQEPRVWRDEEQQLLENTARRIGELITDWAADTRFI